MGARLQKEPQVTPGFVDINTSSTTAGTVNPLKVDVAWVNIVGSNGEIVFTSEIHTLRYARRKGKKLAKLLGYTLRDNTR